MEHRGPAAYLEDGSWDALPPAGPFDDSKEERARKVLALQKEEEELRRLQLENDRLRKHTSLQRAVVFTLLGVLLALLLADLGLIYVAVFQGLDVPPWAFQALRVGDIATLLALVFVAVFNRPSADKLLEALAKKLLGG